MTRALIIVLALLPTLASAQSLDSNALPHCRGHNPLCGGGGGGGGNAPVTLYDYDGSGDIYATDSSGDVYQAR